jgi:precorrin-6A synthase
MRKIFIIGIGAGNPEHVTVQAINALSQVDVVFVMDKGQEKDDLVRLRRDICARYIKDRPYRFVETTDPRRDPAASYEQGVRAWHEQRAGIYERLIGEELGEDGCGAFLVWGDPSLYDSTLRIIDQLVERAGVAFTHEVIPGISAIQVLAARHQITLNRIGKSVHITTGRKLTEGLPDGIDDVVVMLDGDCSFKAIDPTGIDIYWGAYLGTSDEILVAGDLRAVGSEIEQARAAAKARKGWIMDTYLLRKRDA